MELTIEMIEQVLDATGADYQTVKQALTEKEGDVEEAIRAIKESASPEGSPDPAEPEAEEETTEKAGNAEEADPVEELFSDEYADKMVDRLKKRIKAGNVDKIRISKDGKTLLEVPVNVGLLGGLFGLAAVPWAVIIGILTIYGLNCKVEVITADGESEQF